MYPIVSIVKWLTVFGRGEFCVGLDAEDNPDESLPEALRWLLVRLLDLGRNVEGGVKCSCSGFGAVL